MKHRADEFDLEAVEEHLAESPELRHIRVRRRADLLTLESGDPRDPVPHARLRRVSVHLWQLEMSTHTGRWEPTPFRDQLTPLLDMLTDDFAWTLVPIDGP